MKEKIMEIEEMQKRKQTLEHNIVTLLNTFTEETGSNIASIEIVEMLQLKGEPKRIASISLEVLI